MRRGAQKTSGRAIDMPQVLVGLVCIIVCVAQVVVSQPYSLR